MMVQFMLIMDSGIIVNIMIFYKTTIYNGEENNEFIKIYIYIDVFQINIFNNFPTRIKF